MFVKIVHLPQFSAVSFHVKESATPEHEAWTQMKAWAKPRGLFDNPTVHQIYGRNNPTPMDQSVLRGYEFWVTIPDDYPLDNDVTEVHFPGGLYAVVRSKGIKAMIENYEKIFDWIKASELYTPDYPDGYECVNSPGRELEQNIDPLGEDENAMLMDVYVPIKQKVDRHPMDKINQS